MGNICDPKQKQIQIQTEIQIQQKPKQIIPQTQQQSLIQKYTCIICLNLVIFPVQCIQCKTIFCKQCALNWNQKKQKCPKKCSQSWNIIQIQPNYIQLNCPFSNQCKSISYPHTLSQHKNNCIYNPDFSKNAKILKQNYLCNNMHLLSLIINKKGQKQYQFCYQCKQIHKPISKCLICKIYYCYKCRKIKLNKNICPSKIHKYEFKMQKSGICNLCGTNGFILKKGFYKDKKCNFSICEYCYEGLECIEGNELVLDQVVEEGEMNGELSVQILFSFIQSELQQSELQLSRIDGSL